MKRNSIEPNRLSTETSTTQPRKYLFLYIFLVVVLATVYAQFESMPFTSELRDVQFYIVAAGIVSGITALWLNRESLSQEIEDQEAKEALTEQTRISQFPEKFPKLNKIPIIRRTLRWGYKEGWAYSLTLTIIVAAFFMGLMHNLNGHNIREDEFQVVNAAAGYHYTGTFYQWNWLEEDYGEEVSCVLEYADCNYTRAWPHTWLVAKSYDIFGVTERSSRIVSVIFGVIFITATYPIVKFFTKNKQVALLSVAVLALNPFLVETFRYTRMYALLIPLFLILSYLFYRGTTEENKMNLRLSWLNNFINKNLDFNYLFLIPAIALLYLNYLLLPNSLIILPALLIFVAYLAISTKQRKYIITSIAGLLGSLLVSLIYRLGFTDQLLNHMSFFERKNYIYLEYLAHHPFVWQIGIIFLVAGIAILTISKASRQRLVYLYITIGASLPFFIFIADRYARERYISHIIPISIIVIVLAFWLLSRVPRSKLVRGSAVVAILLAAFLNFYSMWSWIYEGDNRYGRYWETYPTIVENYNPDSDVIIGQYLQMFYLRELADKNPEYISMLRLQEYEFDQFITDLHKYESGWVTWETRKGYHLKPEIIEYVENNFQKIHGDDVDDSWVEVYYYDRSMM